MCGANSRLVLSALVAFTAGAHVLGAPALKPLPVTTAEEQALYALVGDLVDKGVRPNADQEKGVLAGFRGSLKRSKVGGEFDDPTLPFEFEKLDRPDVVKTYDRARVATSFLVAGDVRGTLASDSVILASGDVKFTSLQNCLVIGKNVRFTSARNCVIIAEELIRGTAAGVRNGTQPDTVLIAGRWLRVTSANQCICQVLRPSKDPGPEDLAGIPAPAVRITAATNVVFMNRKDDVQTTGNKDGRWVEPKVSSSK